MNNSEETLGQPTSTDAVLQAIAELSKKIDDYKKESDTQFEAIRQGIVHNDVSYDRLKAEVLLLRADVKELSEEIRQNKKVLV
jgi:predicted  nucleic acid-binding Zn-ribbon protein